MSFELGRVLNRTFALVTKAPLPILGTAFLFAAVPTVAYSQVNAALLGDALVSGGPAVQFPLQILGWLVSVLLQAFAYGAIIVTALRLLHGEGAGFGDAARGGIRHFVPLAVINFLYGLGTVLGLFLLIIPGLFLMVKWSAAMPARVGERTGIIEAFSRSWKLTEGAWWPIFGLFVLFAVGSMVLGLGAGVIAGTTGAIFGGDPAAAIEASTSPPALIVIAITSTVTIALAGAGFAAIYHELKTQKEGADTAALENTFA